MFILMGIIAAFIITGIQVAVCMKQRPVKIGLQEFAKNSFVITMFSSAFWKYVFQNDHFLNSSGYGAADFAKFFFLAMMVGLLFLFVQMVMRKCFSLCDPTAPNGKKYTARKVLCIVLTFLGFLCVFLTDWAKKEYGDLASDQVLITYTSPTTGSDMVDYSNVFEGPVFWALFLTMILGLFLFAHSQLLYHRREKVVTILNPSAHRVVSLALALLIFAGGLGYGVHRFQLSALFNAYFAQSDFIEAHYIDPRDAHLQFPEKKRNLIHIYLESMENSYMSKDLGGFMEENLIPELTQIAEEGYSFSDLPDQFGGPQPSVGTTWSVASMVNMTTGLPMKVPTEANEYGCEDNFLPGAYTLGEILAEQGYEQTLMFGADAEFGGLLYYYKSHGDYKIMDHIYAKEHGLIPPDYSVWWGFEDDKLFEFAKDEITRLSKTGKPFNFTMETADTHRPDGYLSEYAPTPYPNQYANVLAYSSSEVEKFIRWIQEQPFYKDTTIVVTGDHLSMETNFFAFYNFDDDYHRTQYNVILNPDPSVATREKDILFNRLYANWDFFPTILSSMGVKFDGARLGIGTDLFSGEQTLFEEYGFEEVNHELEKKSDFYNDNILN